MPVQVIEGIPECVTKHFRVTPAKLRIKCGGQVWERTVPLRRQVKTPENPRKLRAQRAALKRLVTCGVSKPPLSTRRAKAHQAVQERLYEERRRRIRAEQRLTDIEINRRRAAEDRAFERRQRIQEGCIATHKNRLYAAYEKVDKTLFPTYLREGREPGNEFFKAAYREWHANLKAHQARLDSDCSGSRRNFEKVLETSRDFYTSLRKF
ncbi:MAG: hypothetical protein J3K34DRAFT_393969 [Monoraphidium minutum]|nr:MAG: hypothetical protein J3K34DRAFT_393969 [Monoraphidium minutum]